ncbi:neuronal cell adhesion molecule-like isoform X12 [Paramormyrops kingsleyae]|uniref:neuronal cell adhesion molecule-like isoform X12 n=1 Tax=Paramormyrops kingsleyae TaxID=1676925 RepID=UPI003B97AE63
MPAMEGSGKRELCKGVLFVLLWGHMITALEVPLDPKILGELAQPPTITHQSPKNYIIDPRENIVLLCEAKGKPHPSFSWTRNGTHFDIDEDPKVTMRPRSGTLVIDISGEKAEAYEGIYQCMARNIHGTAISNNIVIRQSRSPLWSKENIAPILVQEGVSLVLRCQPPAGLPPPVIIWMDNNFQKLPQDGRVSQAMNGDLYFANVRRQDSRNDYICYARFPHTQTIQQKQPVTVKVLNMDAINETMAPFFNDTDFFGDSPAGERPPTFLLPPGATTSKVVLRGEVLELECIAEGLPTPKISWHRDNGSFHNKRTSFKNFHKTLKIVDITEGDAGDYRCQAENSLGSLEHVITVTVKAAPYWIKAPKNLILSPKETGALTCQAGGDPKPEITWLMNGITIENTHVDPSRKLEGDRITFTDIQVGSSAVYQCNASNEYGYVLANSLVNVLAEPPRVLTPSNKVYQVIAGTRALLDCAVFGSPIPVITWFKDGHVSVTAGDQHSIYENGTLEIQEAHSSHSGRYTCIAVNILGSRENQVFLEVKEPTRILKQPELKVVQRSRAVVFECKVTHDPTLTPTTTWLKDDGGLPDDERFMIGPESLTIQDVTEADVGSYTCIVNTTLDQDSAVTRLTVVEQPDPPMDLELTDQRKRSIQLTWIPGDDHNSPIKKFFVQYEDALHHPGVWKNLTEVPGSKTTAQLKLSPYVHYTFRVLAANAVGFSLPSLPSQQYRTDPAAPDENPSMVEAAGAEHNNLVISWTPLTGLQSNGPGLQYKVSWMQQDVDKDWTSVTVANVSKFVVSGTPTFVPYEVKVQAVNDYGSAPEPEVVLGYSGEDLPLAAPGRIQAVVQNSTLAEVHWEAVSSQMVRGRLKGYKVYYWKERSLLEHNPQHEEQRILTFNGNRTHGKLPGLHPFSLYTFNVRVLNGKGEGPAGPSQQFETPEGVPGPLAFLRFTNINLDSLTLEWGPPLRRNGRLLDYTLKYQTINNTSELGQLVEVSLPANETNFTLPNLKYSTRYKFYISARTKQGAGPAITDEAVTVMDEAMASRQVDIATQGWFIGLMCAIALLILVLLIVCFIKRNKGGKYPVKEKEDAHADPEIQPMKDDDGTFGEYSDTEDHKPLKGSLTPPSGTIRKEDSDDSLVDYGEGGDGQFNEDGSFIGQYSGKRERDVVECDRSSEVPSPVNAMNSFV